MDISPFLAQGSSHHLKENTILCIKGKFSCFCCRLLTFSKINFQKIISEHYQSVKLFGSRSGPRKSCPGLGPNCCIGYLSRLQKSQLALIMKKLKELFIKHKYILVLKIMSAAYFQMNYHRSKHYESRSDCSLGSYLIWIHIFLNPCGGHQTDL